MNPVLLSPALYSHVLHSGIMLFAIVLLILYFSKLQTLDPYKKIKLALMFAVVIGLHGLSHLGLESVYLYNPNTVAKLPCATTFTRSPSLTLRRDPIARNRFHHGSINCPFRDPNGSRMN